MRMCCRRTGRASRCARWGGGGIVAVRHFPTYLSKWGLNHPSARPQGLEGGGGGEGRDSKITLLFLFTMSDSVRNYEQNGRNFRHMV